VRRRSLLSVSPRWLSGIPDPSSRHPFHPLPSCVRREFVSRFLFLSPLPHPSAARVSGQPQNEDGYAYSCAQKTRVPFRSFSSPEILGGNLWLGQDFRPGAEIPPPHFSPVQLSALVKQPSPSEGPPSGTDALPSDSRTSDLVFVHSKIRRTGVQGTHRRCYCRSRRIDLC